MDLPAFRRADHLNEGELSECDILGEANDSIAAQPIEKVPVCSASCR